MVLMRKVLVNRLVALLRTSFTPLSVVRKISSHSDLREVVAKKIAEHREVVRNFREKYGNAIVGEITVNQMYGGMRRMICLLTETSELDPEEGIKFRNRTLEECMEILPKSPGGKVPLPEGLFWLLLTGDVPTYEQARSLSQQWAEQAELPPHVVTLLDNFPPNLSPMSKFSIALTACNTESVFAKAYKEGVPQTRYWEFIYEDVMKLCSKIPVIAATIYRKSVHNISNVCTADPTKDWSHNFACMLGHENSKFIEFLRLFLTIHSDHEGGNASSHTTHLVGSSLSDPFLSLAAGINALAGPIHGLAIQEVLVWIKKLTKRYGLDVTDAQMKEFVWETLKSGQVIPGYGHAVLRKTDPRFIQLRKFALEHVPNEPLVKIVSTAYKVIPPILQKYGKVENPWPNCDSYSGVLFQSLGMKEMQFYTLIFGSARALGVLASLIWDHALQLPMERPTSVTTFELMKLAKTNQNTNHIKNVM